MKVLVLGAGGMVGHVTAIYLNEQGHSVTGFARRNLPFCETIVGDALKVDFTEIVHKYDAIINCIGVLNQAVDADPYNGIYLNACLPHLLSKSSKRIIHISTDCVFSGHDGGGYAESAFRSSDTLYGRSKALGELNNRKDLTIRTSIVGPDINASGIGLFNWFMKQNGKISGYTGAIWSGVTTITLAKAVDAALEQNFTGLYHLTNNSTISKYELLKLFNELRSNPIKISPSDMVNNNKSFVNTRETDFDFTVPSYGQMVSEIRDWLKKYSKYYNYIKGVMANS